MKLLEVCEPLFQYVCRLNRSIRKGGGADYAVVRSEVIGLLEQLRGRAQSDASASVQFGKLELPLIFFIDSIIAESNLPFAAEWDAHRLAHDRNELAGDEKFYDILEETLKDSTEAANERLAVFYTCIGLGFTGWYKGNPAYLEKKMREIAPRIRRYLPPEGEPHVTPLAYANVDTRNLIAPPARKLGGIVVTLIGLIVALFITNVYLYRDCSREIRKCLEGVIGTSAARSQATDAAAPAKPSPARE